MGFTLLYFTPIGSILERSETSFKAVFPAGYGRILVNKAQVAMGGLGKIGLINIL